MIEVCSPGVAVFILNMCASSYLFQSKFILFMQESETGSVPVVDIFSQFIHSLDL
jgi:hypothetical protein